MSDQENWKQRYEKDAREWEATDALLRKVVGRLTIAAEGDSPDLDAVLARIERHARNHEDHSLDSDLRSLTAQLKRSEGRAAGESTATTASSPESDDGSGARDYCEALLDALALDPDQTHSLREFRRQLPDMAPDRSLVELAARIGDLLKGRGGADGDVREVLIALVDEVSIVQPGVGALESLRDLLKRDAGDWQDLLGRVIGEIRSLIQRISSEKHALAQLVRDVSEELGDISSVLVEEGGDLAAGRDRSIALQGVLNAGVQQIQDQVAGESDIAALKAGISRSLEGMRAGIAEFIERDAERFDAAEQRNARLRERVARMEAEAEELQKKLHRNHKRLMEDPLTGARSRLAYDEMLAQEMSRYRRYREPFCLSLLDIDHFKVVNDTFGHSAGDRALKLVAGLVAERIRETDALFRVGGEEFVLLLPRTDLDAAAVLVEAVRQSIGESGFHFENKPVSITVSAGVTVVRDDDTAETLFNRADDAMYRAKKGGRDRLERLE